MIINDFERGNNLPQNGIYYIYLTLHLIKSIIENSVGKLEFTIYN